MRGASEEAGRGRAGVETGAGFTAPTPRLRYLQERFVPPFDVPAGER